MAVVSSPLHSPLRSPLHGPTAGLWASVPTFLPTVASSPILVLSSALLVSGYAGAWQRVQRVSDDVEQDIGYGTKYGDAAAASAFRGASSLGSKIWYDQSGGGWNHSQATKAQQPGVFAEAMYGAIPTISFDSSRVATVTTKQMANTLGPTIDTGASTIFVVAVPTFSFNDNTFYVPPSTSNTLALYTRSNNVGLVGNFWNGASVAAVNSGGTARLIPPIQTSIMAWKTGANKSHRLNGVKFDTAGAATSSSIVGGSIGGDATMGVTFDGRFDAMAIVIYPTALSDADCALVEAALQASFPVTTNQSIKVAFDGDSRVEGFGSTKNRPWTKKLLGTLAMPVYATSMGVSGQTLQTMATNVALRVAGQYDATRYRNIVVMGGAGVNDFSASRTAAQVQADFITYCTGINLAQQKLIVATVCLHTGHTGPQAAERVAYNTWLRANWATYASALVDLDAVSGLDAFNGTDWYDAVHFKDAGHDKWAAAFKPAIEALAV